ncbi:MAG TPA: hypothetical protein VMC83_42795 [Streptosporangiaceae bacterium]|nr:hypothetical protein [Streptosporangiaceae bacterium]
MRKTLGLALGTAAAMGAALVPAAASAAAAAPSARTHAHTVQGAAPGAKPLNPAATPKAAASDPATTVTFAVTSGALTMTAPTAATLGSGAPGGSLSSQLGTVTVTDNRALLSASWTATVASTTFTTGTATGGETIPVADAFYDPGAITTTGSITVTPTGVTLSTTPQAVVAGTAGAGNNSASWNPRLVVTVPTNAVSGTYTGTITHSVS